MTTRGGWVLSAEVYGQLAVCLDPLGEYNLAHIQTGRCIGGYTDVRIARRLAQEFSQIDIDGIEQRRATGKSTEEDWEAMRFIANRRTHVSLDRSHEFPNGDSMLGRIDLGTDPR